MKNNQERGNILIVIYVQHQRWTLLAHNEKYVHRYQYRQCLSL